MRAEDHEWEGGEGQCNSHSKCAREIPEHGDVILLEQRRENWWEALTQAHLCPTLLNPSRGGLEGRAEGQHHISPSHY